jgi:lantibiotic modifying enzyme
MTTTVRPPVEQWDPVLSSTIADRALSVAMDVAERVRGAAREVRPDSPLAGGGAGIALLYGQLDRHQPDQGWDVTAHDFLRVGVRQAEQAGWMGPGLLVGFGGVAYAARLLSKGGTRYGSLLSTLDAQVSRWVLATEPPGHGVRVGTFDVIAGASGIVPYLLDSGMAAELRHLLANLVDVCGNRDGLQNWHTPHDLIVNPLTAKHYPGGNLNCGLSHGSPGILAAMSLAASAGYEVPGQVDAMRALVNWLLDNRIDDEHGPNWPTAVALPLGSDEPIVARTTWCYGAPGVARTLWLAGVALGDHGLRTFAVESMLAACERLPGDLQVNGACLCHGFAGVLQIVLRFAHDTGDPRFAAAAEMITERLLDCHRPESRYGFHSIEPDGSAGDQAGLLEGAAGVALALLAAIVPVTPTWDRAFVLS